ncbi:30S ribosomal protein S21 [Candidatus Gottesmanbacteria bacterium]|nr:30S ribosomal protein S21 [Candidatus Gottesmanbacteria bacterium]
MAVVKAQPGDTSDSMIRKFSKKVVTEGILQDIKKREIYQKPSQRRKEEKKERQRRKFGRRTYG